MKSLTVAFLGVVIILGVSSTDSSAQTITFTNGGSDGLWQTAANWTPTGVPTTTSNVVIGTLPTGGTLFINTGGNPTDIASLTFGSSPGLNGTTTIVQNITETLELNGAITNLSNFNQVFDISVFAAASATYDGGAQGITFNSNNAGLTLSNNTGLGGPTPVPTIIHTAGTITVSNNLVFQLNSDTTSTPTSTSGYSRIIQNSGTLDVSGGTIFLTGGPYTGNAGDFFQLVTAAAGGTVLLPTAVDTSNLSALSPTLVAISTLIKKGIEFIQPAAGGNLINAGFTYPIGYDSEFNPIGSAAFNVTLNGGEVVTANNGSLDTGGVANAPYVTSNLIGINTTGGTLASVTGNVATYNGVIADGNGGTGILTIGDASNTGIVVLAAANTYDGGTQIAAGTTLTVSNMTGSATGTGALNLAAGTLAAGPTTLNGTGSVAGVVTLNGGPSLIDGDFLSSTGTLTTGGISVNNTNNTIASGTVVGNTTLNGAAALVDNGAITGTISIGAGTLSGTGSVSGAATLNGGIVNFGAGGNLASTLAVTGGNWNGVGSVTGLTTSSSGIFNIGTGANLTATGNLNVTGGTLTSTDSTGTITGNVAYSSATSSTFGGILAGAGKTLVKSGASTLTLSGTNANTATGATSVTGGELDLSKTAGVTAVAGDLVIGNNTGAANSDVVKLINSNQIATTSNVTVNNDGQLALNGKTNTVATLTSAGGDITSATAGGNLTVSGAAAFNTTGNTIGAGATVTDATTATLGANASLAVNGTLADSLTVGNGTLTGSGSVSNNVTVAGGTIGMTAGTIGGTLVATGGATINGTETVAGQVTSNSGAFAIGSGANLTATTGVNIAGGTLTAGNAASTITGSVNYTSGAASTFGGVIAGAGKTLTVNNAGTTLTLTGANTYTGVTTDAAGALIVNGSTAAGSAVTIGNNTAVATLEGTGTIGGSVTLASTGGNIAHLDPGAVVGTAGTLHVGSLTIGGGSALDIDLATATTVGGGVNDLVNLTGGALAFSGTTVVNFDALGTLTTGSAYTLINGAGSISGFNANNFTTSGLNGLIATFTTTANSLLVTFTQASGYFFTGGDGANPTFLSLADNYATSVSGTTPQTIAPDATSDVVLSATTATQTSVNVNTNLAFHSLTFNGNTTNLVTGANTLTLGGGGLNTTAAGTYTISAPLAESANQAWTIASGSTVIASGGVNFGANTWTKAGLGTLDLNAADVGTGAIVISAGATNIQNNGALGTASSVTVNSGAALQMSGGITTTAATPLTLNGTGIGAAGALESLSGVETYTGAITLASASSIGSDAGSTLDLTNAAGITGAFALSLVGNGDINITGPIAIGANPLTKSGTGTTTLSGVNTFTGATTVTGGTLAIAGGNGLATSSGLSLASGTIFNISTGGNQTIKDLTGVAGADIVLGANDLTLGTANSTEYDGTIEGTNGSITKVGTGTLILTGANTYTGATNINGGILSVTADNNLGLGTSITLGGGELFTNGTFTTTKTVALNAGTDILAAASGTTANYGGVISGGGVTIGDGTNTGVITFSAAETYTGATTVTSTGRLLIGNGTNGSIANTSAISVAAGGQLAFNEANGSTQTNTIADNGTVFGFENVGNTNTLGGIISGTGGFTQQGAGETILNAAETYTGATSVLGGTLQIGNGTGSTGAIANTSAVSVTAGTLAFDEANGSTQSNAIANAGTVAGAEGAGITNTLSGNITGTGAFTQSGAGTTVLSGADSYAGATTVSAGTLQVGNGTTGSIAGGSAVTVATGATFALDEVNNSLISNAITDNGTVTTLQSGNNMLSGNIGGTGGFVQAGTGGTLLTGAESYGGTTAVNAGTLQLGNGTSGSFTGGGGITVAGGATLAVDETTGSTLTNAIADAGSVIGAEGAGITNTLSGAITGAGSFSQLGAGTTILSGANNFAGSTTIAAGAVDVHVGSHIGAGALGMSGGTLDLGTTTQTVGAVSITGASTIQNGTLTGTSYADSAASGTSTISASLTGPGALTKAGGDTLILSGPNNNFSGGVNLSAGTLAVGNSGALGTGAYVQSGGNLTTTGNGGIQINVNGFDQTAGTLTLQVNAAGDPVTGLNAANDLLHVAGSATLDGNLTLKFNYVPTKGDIFDVVQTTTGINGVPSAGYLVPLASPAGYQLTGAVAPGGDDLIVTVESVQFALTGLATGNLTPNETAILNYIDTNINGATNPQFNAALTQALAATGGNTSGTSPALQALAIQIADSMNPEKFANFARSNTFNNATFTTQLFDNYFETQRSSQGNFTASNGQLDSSALTVLSPEMDPALAQSASRLLAWSPAPLAHGLLSDSSTPVLGGTDMKQMAPAAPTSQEKPYNVFIAGSVVLAQNFSQPDLAHTDSTTGGVQMGADYRITPHLRAGAAFAYNHTDADLDTQGSAATVDSYAPGVYVSYADSGWYANALGSYGFDNFTEDRRVTIGAATAMAHGAPSGDQIVGNLDGGYDFHRGNWTFGPLAGVQYTHLDVDSYSEGGADSLGANLSVSKQQADSLRSRFGGHVSYVLQTGKILLTPHLDASWQHEFMDQASGINAQIANVTGAPFTVTTPNPSRDSALIDCGLNADLTGTVTVFGDYVVQAGQDNYFGQSVQAGVKIGF